MAPTRLAAAVPAHLTAWLFDLDGVLTRTARAHRQAWAEVFDELLRDRSARTGEPFRPFTDDDYARHVDGKLRLDGVRGFLGSRGVTLPEGSPGDPPEADTVHGIGSRKNVRLLDIFERDGVEVYDRSVRFVAAVRERGHRTAVVSASRNCRAALVAAGIEDLFEVRVDGLTAAAEHLAGKPAPDLFLTAADRLGVRPGDAAVVEDALAGVAAGRAGGFGFVVGVDRAGQAAELLASGADVVVDELDELLEES